MKNYILHIGLPKTGTTALQRHYFSRLRYQSICYNPLAINASLVHAIKLLDFGSLKQEDMNLLNDFIQYQSNKIPQDNIFISLELLSQRLMQFDFSARGDFLESLFPDATIVMVLRYQPELLRGLYQQHVQQNYFLMPEEVFMPFATHVFPETEYWKTSMQINVKQWDYKETIRNFRNRFGERFHVLFYEDYKKNILHIGRRILELAGFHTEEVTPDAPLPRANISYDSATMYMLLNMARCKLAFHSSSGFDSQHMQDLMEQARQARYIFDAANIQDFMGRLVNQRNVSRCTYSGFDMQLLRIINILNQKHDSSISQGYELPKPIKSYLEQESKTLNSSLDEVVDRRKIPKQYL